ncbi:hypothetical protein ACQB60_10365 [Actinomycetota bacterium Odt1-20B]
MRACPHVLPTAPDDERDLARWEDDGAPLWQGPPGRHEAHWARIAAALAARLPELADRDDIVVTCETSTRSGAPAAFFPALAQLEIQRRLFRPHHPSAIDPAKAGDEENYPVAWGAFTHEAAHAAHTHWNIPPELRGTALDEAAQVLEESRAEYAHLARRPADRRYLRSCVREIVFDTITADADADAPTGAWQAGIAAALILARRDAGILDAAETAPLSDVVEGVLGTDTLDRLTRIWQAAHTTADDDQQTMLDHARAWCTTLDVSPEQPEPALACGKFSSEVSDRHGTGGMAPAVTAGHLAAALDEVTSSVTEQEAAERRAREHTAAARAARETERAAVRRAHKTADQVFAPGARPYAVGGRGRARTPITGKRPPTRAEKTAAGQLARALKAAAYRESAATRTASPVPPGRLNMRQALARDAQLAAGATQTATPFTRTTHRAVPNPPLRVGIAVDVSGSMYEATGPIASAAWILSRATALTDPDSASATVAFDEAVTAITTPHRAPTQVATFTARGNYEALTEAIDALTGGLALNTPGAGRLLVIASDGCLPARQARTAADRIQSLRTAGCPVLWLAFTALTFPLPGTTVIRLKDPTQAAPVIAKAATAALAATRP